MQRLAWRSYRIQRRLMPRVSPLVLKPVLLLPGVCWSVAWRGTHKKIVTCVKANASTPRLVLCCQRFDRRRHANGNRAPYQNYTTSRISERPPRGGLSFYTAMPAIGPKRTSQIAPHMSAFGGKADMI